MCSSTQVRFQFSRPKNQSCFPSCKPTLTRNEILDIERTVFFLPLPHRKQGLGALKMALERGYVQLARSILCTAFRDAPRSGPITDGSCPNSRGGRGVSPSRLFSRLHKPKRPVFYHTTSLIDIAFLLTFFSLQTALWPPSKLFGPASFEDKVAHLSPVLVTERT